MSSLTLNQLQAMIGDQKVVGFFLVLARVTPLFVIAPLFSSKMVPMRVRGVVGVGLAIGLTSVAVHGHRIPTQPFQVAALLVEELLIGLAFAFAVSVVFAAVQLAGTLTDAISGFSFGSLVDPLTGNQGGVLNQLYSLVGLAIFLAIGGDAWMLRGIARTFDLVPVTGAPRMASLAAGAEQACSSLFGAALEVAAPAMLALVITDVAFGMVSRVVPQLNVFAVAFPVKIGVALAVVGASLPFLGNWMSDQLGASVASALHAVGG
jgi:flagellar biosynthetic protein FliR